MVASELLPTPPACARVDLPRELRPDEKWWNVNVPQEQQTDQCPDFLRGQSEKDISILSIRDDDHPRMPWSDVKALIDADQIDQFHRMPSDLRRYFQYCHHLQQHHGSILNFMRYERLNWPTIDPRSSVPFEDETDYKILYNDWPYALDRDIVHIVVWTKFMLEDDPLTGRLTAEGRRRVEDFVFNTFCHSNGALHTALDPDDVRWFKNWRSLRSVHALEHFHIMLYRPPRELIHRVTNGDQPMCDRVDQL